MSDHHYHHQQAVSDPPPRNRLLVMRNALALVSQCIASLDDELEELVASLVSEGDGMALLVTFSDMRGGGHARAWRRMRNSPTWLYDYALHADIRLSPTWSAIFRVPHEIYCRLVAAVKSRIEASERARGRRPLASELRVAAFLMYVGGGTCERVATTLGIGRSTVNDSVRHVSDIICRAFTEEVMFPSETEKIAQVMAGFQALAGLPYCIGAVDGTHIRWPACPEDQYYEYRCYKGFTSVIVFAVCDAERRILYADVGLPGVLGDSSIYERSALKRNMEGRKWLGEATVRDLSVAGIKVSPYLMGDCAFTLNVNVMKSSSEAEMKANPVLRVWDRLASTTRKPIECAFGILKNRFPLHRTGIYLKHENTISVMLMACLILHNMSLTDSNDYKSSLLPDDTEGNEVEVTGETVAGRVKRDALLYYVLH